MSNIDDILGKMLTETREINMNRVPYAFEKRVMAHIKETPQMALNIWAQWSQPLWRSVIPCFAIMVLVALWVNTDTSNSQPSQSKQNGTIAYSGPAEDELETIVMFAIEPAETDQ